MRSLSTPLIQSLMEEEPFRYAHLVKFEKPIKTESGKPTKAATSYSYITDASIDISYDDGSYNALGTVANGTQTYIANRLLDVSGISETIEARASNFSITIGATALNTSLSGSFTVTGSNPYTITGTQNLVEAGFLEGDEIFLTGLGWTGRINTFTTSGGVLNAAASLTVVDGAGSTGSVTKIAVNTKDIGAILLDKTNSSYARYINREVYVYKAHINVTNGAIIGTPFLLFKGIITSGNLTEDPTSESKMVWNISSHWGDWVRVNGRITSDSSHRALSNDGTSDRSALIRPEYADDLGFLHSEQALNIMASYKVSETRYKTKKSGLFGLKVKIKEYQVMVDREVDLRFNLEAKYLPVVYGVQRLDSIPFFVDTDKNAPNKVYAAYALCEGEIGGIFDIYFGDQSSICLDYDDNQVRGSASTTANIDVVCSGRADRGDTLAAQTVIDTSTTNYADILRFNTGQLTGGLNLFAANFDRRYFNRDSNFTGGVAATVNPLGITHEKGRSFADPIDCKFVLHTGKSEQRADDLLVAKAQNNEFKVQGSYYAGDKSQYWGANHRVLDTAYVTAEYVLSEGEEELPSVEFIVKGKAVECYNYDYSYIHDPTAVGETAPTIGSTVSLNTGATGLVVADVFTDEFGQTRVRFLTDPGIGTNSKFNITGTVYTLLASNAVLLSGSVPSVLQTAVSSSTFNSTTQTYNITTGAGGIGSFGGVNLPDLRFTIADVLTSNTANLTNEQKNQIRIRLGGSSVPATSTGTSITGITNNTNVAPAFVITKNGIKLASGASASNDAYNTFIIELIRTNTDGSIIVQKRTITDYDGTNLIATVDRDWDAVYYPNTGDIYKIYAPSDKRITNNPAMQLLDYITSVRYGRGLDVTSDINLDSFKSSARKCDTRSDVTLTTTTQATVGDIYTFTSTTLKFRGTVTSSTLINGLYETTFTDVIGKIGNKWVDWKSFAVGDYIWKDGVVYRVDTAGTFLTWPPTSNATLISSTFALSRVGGGTITVSIASASFDGNPIVKKYVSSSKSYISGYSLYDSDDVKYWRYVGWNEQNQRHVTRHQTNIIINTSNPVFDNINTLLGHFNGILRYNAGKYELDVESQHTATSAVYGYNEVNPDLTTWTGLSATISAGGITGPSGGDNNVIKITEAATSPTSTAHIIRSTTWPTISDNEVVVFSAYLKSGTYTAGGLRILLKSNVTASASFDLTGNGAYKIITSAQTLAAGIYSVGNGWYRCWVAGNVGSGATVPRADIAIDNTYTDSTLNYSSSLATNFIYASSAKAEFYRSLDYNAGPTSYLYYPNIIAEEDIIGSISIEDPGNKDTFNTISVDIPDPRNRFEERSVTYFNSTYLIEDNSVPKKGDMKATGITNYFNARLNAKQYLEQSRYGLKINFTMPPKGILITAGEIIEITNARLGFVSKPFRVTNLTVNKDCLVQISADEHTNNAYSIAPSSGGVFASSEPIKGITLAPKDPTSATATNNLSGLITLNWTNPVGFNSDTDSIEIYRAQGASSIQTSSNLIAVVLGGSVTYSDPISVATDTFYNYWLRTRRDSYRSSNNSNVKTYSNYTATIAGKVLASTSTTVYTIVTSAPVIFKDAPDAATSGAHTAVTISGRKIVGNTITSPFGFVTITGNGDTEVSPAPTNSIYFSPTNTSGKTIYSARLYDTSPKTTLLDSQDIPVVFKGTSGASGTDPITIAYTNGSHTVPVTTSGVETWLGSGGKLYIYRGQTALTLVSNTIGAAVGTTDDRYVITSITNVSGNTLTAPASVSGSGTTETTIGDFAGDLNTVTVYRITATVRVSGTNYTRVTDVTFAPANQGATGNDATAYWISANPGALSKNNVNAFTPSSVIFSSYSQVGTGLASLYSGRFKIYENGSGTASYTSSVDQSSYSYIPSSGCTSIKAELYASGGTTTKLDEEGVSILNSASNIITAELSNDSHVFPADNTGAVTTYANSGTNITVYEGANILTYSPTGTGNSMWTVSSSPTNITAATPINNNTYATYNYTSGVATGTDTSTVSYIITGKSSTGATFSIEKVQKFTKAKTGNTGANAVVAVLSKDSHVFPASPDGTVTNYTNANTELRVYDGATLLTYSPPGANNGKWTVSSTVGSNITVPTATDSGTFATYTYTTGVLAGTDTSTATFNISGKTTGGTSFSLVKVQSFSKSKVGNDGTPGDNGSPATYITLTKSAATVISYADGNVKTGELPVGGTLKVYNGATDVTASSILSSSNSGCVGSITGGTGVYSITSLSADTGVLTLSAQYNSITYTATFTVSKSKIGYEIVASSPTTDNFNGRMAFFTSDGKLYRYTGTSPTGYWTKAVDGADLIANSIQATSFATSIEPIAQSASLPGATKINNANTVFYTGNAKLYRWTQPSGPYTLAVDGNDIVSNSITAGQIAAFAIGAGQIAAGAITTSKLSIGDLSVQNKNWNFEEGDVSWTKGGGWAISPDGTNAKSGSYVGVKLPGITSSTSIVNDQKVSTEANETFYAEAYIKHAAGNVGTVSPSWGAAVRCVITDSAGALVTGGTLTGNWISPATTTYTKSYLAVTVPSPSTGNRPAFIDVRVVNQNMSTNNGIYVDEVRLFRTSNATLIADGAITTSKVFAEAITADKILTGSITAAQIATNTITADRMTSNSVTARELAISNDATGGTGIFMDSGNNRIDIFDSGTLRVRIGNLA